MSEVKTTKTKKSLCNANTYFNLKCTQKNKICLPLKLFLLSEKVFLVHTGEKNEMTHTKIISDNFAIFL